MIFNTAPRKTAINYTMLWKDGSRYRIISISGVLQKVEVQLLDERVFILRYRKLVMDIHVVAYLLRPSNHLVTDACLTLEYHFAGLLIRFYKQYEVDHLISVSQFYEFRAQKRDFNAESTCWACISEAVLFWRVCFLIS